MNNWEISSSDVVLSAVSGLPSTPTLTGGNRIVYPSNPNLHLKYVFYLKVSAAGGSYLFWGPYTLDIGCTSTSFTYADASGLPVTGVAKWVGDSVDTVYTFTNPTFTLPYCPPISNEAWQADGSGASTKVDNCASQVCTVFALKDTIHEETVTFKIKTTFTGSLITHLSPVITTTITCNNNYPLSEVSAPTNP